jgi:hypothetical protein
MVHRTIDPRRAFSGAGTGEYEGLTVYEVAYTLITNKPL